jgi:hypothetical protein
MYMRTTVAVAVCQQIFLLGEGHGLVELAEDFYASHARDSTA